MRDEDAVLIARAALLTVAVICQRVAEWVGRLGIACEARYAQITEAAHG